MVEADGINALAISGDKKYAIKMPPKKIANPVTSLILVF